MQLELKKYRIKAGITQQAIADVINVSTSVVARYESGIILPTPHTIEKICHLLRITPNDLFGWSPPTPAPDLNGLAGCMAALLQWLRGMGVDLNTTDPAHLADAAVGLYELWLAENGKPSDATFDSLWPMLKRRMVMMPEQDGAEKTTKGKKRG